MASLGIEQVEITGLKVDLRYQRQLSVARVKRMVDEWDDLAAGVIVVSRRSAGDHGHLVLLDGQHRVEAARKLGRTHMIAVVYDGLTLREEARMFTLINAARSPVSAITRFKARLVYGDAKAAKIHGIVNDAGGRIDSGHIKCVSALELVFDRQGPTVLKRALEILHEAYGALNGDTVRATLVIALAQLIKDNPAFNGRRLAHVIRDRSAKQWTASATALSRKTGEYAPKLLRAGLESRYRKAVTEGQVAGTAA